MGLCTNGDEMSTPVWWVRFSELVRLIVMAFDAFYNRSGESPNSFRVEQLGSNNLFLLSFGNREERQRVLAGDPWSFENQLLSLVKPQGLVEISTMNFNLVPFWIHILNILIASLTERCARFVSGEVDVKAEGVFEEEIGAAALKRLRYGSWLRAPISSIRPRTDLNSGRDVPNANPGSSMGVVKETASVFQVREHSLNENREIEEELEVYGVSTVEQLARRKEMEM
ncbi:hypothetical protein PanWU01x14_018910, partial [Parasponia andersonii]